MSFNVGRSSIGGNAGTYNAGVTGLGGPFVMPQDGVLQSASVYISSASGSAFFLGVYDNTGAGASPGNLLATSASAIDSTTGFVTLPMLTNPTILNGVSFNVAVLAPTVTINGVFANTGEAFYFDSGGDSVLPAIYPGGTTFAAVGISIYATFNPPSSATGPFVNVWLPRG